LTTALDIIQGALKRINSYMPGEVLSTHDSNDALETLNDLLDSLSTQENYVYGSLENILTFTAGQYQYTIGTGGNFNVQRPLRVTNAFTRITSSSSGGLDYPIEIIDQTSYANIGLKRLPGPWPVALFYNPTFPLGNLSFYPAPGSAGELHLFTDTILSNIATLATVISLPQGYNRMLKLLLAEELIIEYGLAVPPMLLKKSKEAADAIKAINSTPIPVMTLDSDLVRGNRTDAGWILHGGFGR
jgi:hypothetical protein